MSVILRDEAICHLPLQKVTVNIYRQEDVLMNMTKIVCPSCESVGQMSLIDKHYRGPYRCWKCRSNFLIEMQDGVLESCSPMDQAEFDRFAAEKAARDRQKRF